MRILPDGVRAEDVAIGAIHDPVSERRHEAINLIKNVRVYDDLELMLDGEAPDFVDVASPPGVASRGGAGGVGRRRARARRKATGALALPSSMSWRRLRVAKAARSDVRA